MSITARPISRPAVGSAFSLVELLVVISIIALLTGIILPAFGRARSIARQTVCQSRLRQWGLAFETYAVENDGYYPHIDGRDRTPNNPQTGAEMADYYSGWIDVLPPLMGEKPWRDYDYWQKPGNNTIFQCPPAIIRYFNAPAPNWHRIRVINTGRRGAAIFPTL